MTDETKQVLSYTTEELDTIAKATLMELKLTWIPEEYPLGDLTYDQAMLWYIVERDYLELANTNWQAYEQAIQPGLCELGIKIFALTYSSVSISPERLEELQELVTDSIFGSLRHMCSKDTLSFWDSLGLRAGGVVDVRPLSHTTSLPDTPYVFVSLTGRDVEHAFASRATLYRRMNSSNTEFSMPDVVCHTTILDAIRKCNNNGYIYVYDNDGTFIESIKLQDNAKAMSAINKYLPESKKLSEEEIKRFRMEVSLSSSKLSAKTYLRSRYNKATAITDFILIVDIKTLATRLVFTELKGYFVH